MTDRFLVRKLPAPVQQIDWANDTSYEAQWEMWDTVLNTRIGPTFGKLFESEATARDFAEKWNFTEGPPRRCGSCGKELAEGERTYGHQYYRVLCFSCSCAQDDG